MNYVTSSESSCQHEWSAPHAGVAMRFALMIEPQQGLTYGDQVAVAKRAEANGFEALFRSDHYASFPGRRACRRPTPGPSWPGSPARHDRIGLGRAGLAGHVPAPRELRQGRDDRRRDERRSRRGGRRGRLERRSSIASYGLPFPPIDERADLLEEPAGDPPRPVGRARRLVVHRHARSRSRTPCSGRSRSRSRAGRPAERRAAPRIIIGGEGSPRGLRIAAR